MRPLRPLLRLHQPLTGGDAGHTARTAARRRLPLAAAVLFAAGLALAGAVVHGQAAARAIAPGTSNRSAPVLAAPTSSLETPGTTSRISLGLQNEQLAAASTHASISTDGRYAVFRAGFTSASGVELGKILLRDRVAGTTTLVAQGSIGGQIAIIVSGVSQPVISGDGRWVAFVVGNPSSRTPTGTIDLWDRTTGTVSQAFSTHLGAFQDEPALSSDGRLVAFRTDGAYASADVNKVSDIYVFDRQAGTFDWASQPLAPVAGAGGSSAQPAISPDGRFVVFASTVPGMVSQPVAAGTAEVYLRDRTNGTTQLLSVASDGTAGTGGNTSPTVAANGAVVAFVTRSDNLASGASDSAQVMAWSAASGALTLVSADPTGALGDADSAQPAISADGRSVAFSSSAANLVPTDGNQVSDIFVRDLIAARTTRVSVAAGTTEATGPSFAPAISGNGGAVAFESDAANLVADDSNGVRDVFVRDRLARVVLAPSPVDFGTVAVGSAGATRQVTATNTGAGPVVILGSAIGGPGAAAFTVTTDGCTGQTLFTGESCQLAVSLSAAAAGSVNATLQVADTAPGAPHQVRLLALALPGTGPTIILSPTVGPPGTVVAVTGTGFPPGQSVTFSWNAGITPTALGPTTVAGDGSFHAQVLVLPNDILGPRSLIAAPQGGGSVPATAPFLVVPHTSVPPVSPWLRQLFPKIERPLVQRH